MGCTSKVFCWHDCRKNVSRLSLFNTPCLASITKGSRKTGATETEWRLRKRPVRLLITMDFWIKFDCWIEVQFCYWSPWCPFKMEGGIMSRDVYSSAHFFLLPSLREIGNLSNDDGNARRRRLLKNKFRHSITYHENTKLKYKKLATIVRVLQTTQNLVFSRCCFADRDG